MDKDRLIVNEVILVGKVRTGKESLPVSTQPVGEEATPDAIEAFKKSLQEKYQFTRDTKLNAKASAVGLRAGLFFHLLVSQFGDNTVTVGGKTIRVNKKTTKYGWRTVFKSASPILFDEIAEQLKSKNWAFVEVCDIPNGGTKNGRCKIKLTEFGIMGFWDEYPTGFAFTPHTVDPEGGAPKPMMSTSRDKKTGEYKKGLAVARTIRHFVLEEEVDNLPSIREALISQVEEYKIAEPLENLDPGKSGAEPEAGEKANVETEHLD